MSSATVVIGPLRVKGVKLSQYLLVICTCVEPEQAMNKPTVNVLKSYMPLAVDRNL